MTDSPLATPNSNHLQRATRLRGVAREMSSGWPSARTTSLRFAPSRADSTRPTRCYARRVWRASGYAMDVAAATNTLSREPVVPQKASRC